VKGVSGFEGKEEGSRTLRGEVKGGGGRTGGGGEIILRWGEDAFVQKEKINGKGGGRALERGVEDQLKT